MFYLIIFIVSEVSVLFSDKMESLFSSQKFDFLSDIFMKKTGEDDSFAAIHFVKADFEGTVYFS